MRKEQHSVLNQKIFTTLEVLSKKSLIFITEIKKNYFHKNSKKKIIFKAPNNCKMSCDKTLVKKLFSALRYKKQKRVSKKLFLLPYC